MLEVFLRPRSRFWQNAVFEGAMMLTFEDDELRPFR
jgi:hypothetical protein